MKNSITSFFFACLALLCCATSLLAAEIGDYLYTGHASNDWNNAGAWNKYYDDGTGLGWHHSPTIPPGSGNFTITLPGNSQVVIGSAVSLTGNIKVEALSYGSIRLANNATFNFNATFVYMPRFFGAGTVNLRPDFINVSPENGCFGNEDITINVQAGASTNISYVEMNGNSIFNNYGTITPVQIPSNVVFVSTGNGKIYNRATGIIICVPALTNTCFTQGSFLNYGTFNYSLESIYNSFYTFTNYGTFNMLAGNLTIDQFTNTANGTINISGGARMRTGTENSFSSPGFISVAAGGEITTGNQGNMTIDYSNPVLVNNGYVTNIKFTRAGNQTLQGNGRYGYVWVNKPSGNLLLQGSMNFYHSPSGGTLNYAKLTFVKGKIVMNGFDMVFPLAATPIVGASATNYIVQNNTGRIVRKMFSQSSEQFEIFPIGSATAYQPIRLAGPAYMMRVGVGTVSAPTPAAAYVASEWTIENQSAEGCEFWAQPGWMAAQETGGFDRMGSLVIGERKGAGWSAAVAALSGSGPYFAGGNIAPTGSVSKVLVANTGLAAPTNAPSEKPVIRFVDTGSDKVALFWDEPFGTLASAGYKYNVRYRLVGTAAWTNKKTTANYYQTTAIAPAGVYEFQVKQILGTGWSTPVSRSIGATPADCLQKPSVMEEYSRCETGITKATLAVNFAETGSKYQIRYGYNPAYEVWECGVNNLVDKAYPTNGTTLTNFTLQSVTPNTLGYLAPNTCHQWQARYKCPDGTYGPWSGSRYFYTSSCPTSLEAIADDRAATDLLDVIGLVLQIQPTLVQDDLGLRLTNLSEIDNSTLTCTLQDMSGKVVLRRDFDFLQGKNAFQLPVSSLLPGMYFVTVTAGGQRWVQKVVKM